VPSYIRTEPRRYGCELQGTLPPLSIDGLLDNRLLVLAQEALIPLKGREVVAKNSVESWVKSIRVSRALVA